MKNHLKRLAAPKEWVLNRHENKYVVKPNPGAHSLKRGLALGFILRDMLGLARSMDEAKKLLVREKILVDGVERKDHRFAVGLFDVVSVELLKKNYRVVLDNKARLALIEIPSGEAGLKIAKVRGKSLIKGARVQLNLHDGRNVLSSENVEVGDSLVVSLPKAEVKEVIPLKEGTTVFLLAGKNGGAVGIVEDIKKDQAVFRCGEKMITTARRHLMAVGVGGKSVCKIGDQ